MNYLAEELRGLWTNDIQTSFLEELENMQASLADYSNLTDEYAALWIWPRRSLRRTAWTRTGPSVLTAATGRLPLYCPDIPYLKRSGLT
jgi:hypothetical protein